jgi:signal transduction histidine kinase
MWLVSLLWLVLLVSGFLRDGGPLGARVSILAPWVLISAFTNLLPIMGWQAAHLTSDMPIQIAAAVALPPLEAGLVCFLGALDPREFRGEISLTKGVFNRTQVGVTAFSAALVVRAISPSPTGSAAILPLSFAALATASSLNYILVALEMSLEHGYSVPKVVRRLIIGTPSDFVLTYLAWGVLGAMLVALYAEVHAWALVAFAAPVLLSRQVLQRSQMLVDTTQAYTSREEAVAAVSRQILQERWDERKLIAADLHDEVLQPLFKVTLMSQVIKADLARGRLLDLDQDLPELQTAASLAVSSLRDLIADLRASSLGPRGISPALTQLVEELGTQSGTSIQASIATMELDAPKQLALYQIAKEALINAMHHSGADSIWVTLESVDSGVRLCVRDDGRGFDLSAPKQRHYGIAIMRERAALARGQLFIDSAPGQGCAVTLLLP